MSQGAFAGLRVLELTQGIPGPYAARFMADQGADVIKIEPPEGDPYRRDPGFQGINRNKRSVVADDTMGLAAQLAPYADVLVVPDATTAARLRPVAPEAVVVSFPIWSEAGEATASSLPNNPDAIPAATGIAWNQISYSEQPVDVVVPLAAYGAGMLGAVAIAAGLYAREIGARQTASTETAAPTYEVSDVAGSGAMQIGDFIAAEGGWGPEREGASPLGSTGRAPAYRLLRTADDQWLFLACGTTAFYEAMLTAIGRTDLLGDERLPEPPWGLLDLDALAFITPILEEAFAGRSRDEWLKILADHDVPCQPVQTREEFLKSHLAKSNGLDVSVQHPELGEVRVPPQPFWMSECDAAGLVAAPLLGQHTEEVLAELLGGASSDADFASPANSAASPTTASPTATSTAVPAPALTLGPAAPLAGVQAIDLSSFIAGPTITRHLAMLGADVIKVESPQGDPFRVLGPYFHGWNQAKRSIALDLKATADQEIFQALLAGTDVVVENFRPGVAERLGCSETEMRAVRPDLVNVKSPGYGACEEMAHLAAFDPLLQALGGIMEAQGGGEEPVFLTVPVHDAATPLIATFGVIAGLHHRARTGQGQTVHTSLTQTVQATQVAEMTDFEGRPPARRGGFDFLGDNAAGRYERVTEKSGEAGADWVWMPSRDGSDLAEQTAPVPVCKTGFVGSEAALEAGLVAEYPETDWGSVSQVGQLIVGAGGQPAYGPELDEHRAELIALSEQLRNQNTNQPSTS